jgi:hypothetical protein
MGRPKNSKNSQYWDSLPFCMLPRSTDRGGEPNIASVVATVALASSDGAPGAARGSLAPWAGSVIAFS